MPEPASAEAIAAFLRAAGLDLDEDPPPTDVLIQQVADVSRDLEDELARSDYVSARTSFNRLLNLYPELKIPIDLATDPAVRDPLIDVYEAAVALRIKAAGILRPADGREDGWRGDA